MTTYVPPKVWQPKESGGQFASINSPTAGAREEKVLPVGKHPLQLYSMGTPNGVKVTILLEELLAAGVSQAEYDAFFISIMDGDQFGSGFVDINPNSKIPALVDTSVTPNQSVFESGAILLYLAEKFDKFLGANRADTLSWLMWQMGSAPFVGGGFGHFYAYAPEKYEYPIDRYTMEAKRQLDVLDKRLANNEYICGDEYTIADMAIFPWYGSLVLNRAYDAAEFLDAQSYTHVMRWAKQIDSREAVKRGIRVNTTWGDNPVKERHSAADLD